VFVSSFSQASTLHSHSQTHNSRRVPDGSGICKSLSHEPNHWPAPSSPSQKTTMTAEIRSSVFPVNSSHKSPKCTPCSPFHFCAHCANIWRYCAFRFLPFLVTNPSSASRKILLFAPRVFTVAVVNFESRNFANNATRLERFARLVVAPR
jgi:hypothetical protein